MPRRKALERGPQNIKQTFHCAICRGNSNYCRGKTVEWSKSFRLFFSRSRINQAHCGCLESNYQSYGRFDVGCTFHLPLGEGVESSRNLVRCIGSYLVPDVFYWEGVEIQSSDDSFLTLSEIETQMKHRQIVRTKFWLPALQSPEKILILFGIRIRDGAIS